MMKRIRKPVTMGEKKYILELHDIGINQRKIAQRLNRSLSTVNNILNKDIEKIKAYLKINPNLNHVTIRKDK